MLSAFSWVFYGVVEDPLVVEKMLNKRRLHEMHVGDLENAGVKVLITDSGHTYLISRYQRFKKTAENESVKVGDPEFSVVDVANPSSPITDKTFFEGIIPKDLKCGDVMLHSLWARRHGTKYNGAPYIVQKAGAAVYTEAGKAQIKEQIAYYQKNARTIYEGLKNAGYTVSGAVNSPYVWLKTPDNMTSWEFFDFLLEKANVVGTPGSGFGPSGEGYFRLTAFGSYENTLEAIKRIENI